MDLTNITKKLTDATTALAKADKDLKLEIAGAAADAAGLVDPTPTSDLVGAGISIARGDYWGAALSTVSMVPYLGDAVAKPVKAVRATKAIASLEKKVAALSKTVNDLKKAKKEAEALEAAKNSKLAKEADAAKDAAAQQEKAAAKKGKDCEDCKSSKSKPKLKAGTPEHKANRWERYQKRGGEKDYEQWSKQYDVNMRNYKYGAEREAEYRKFMDATEGTLDTPFGKRQVDILKESEMYAGQLKTGPVSLTKENILAIKKDAALVDRGFQVEHILEQGASKPYLKALEDAGIDYVLKPKF